MEVESKCAESGKKYIYRKGGGVCIQYIYFLSEPVRFPFRRNIENGYYGFPSAFVSMLRETSLKADRKESGPRFGAIRLCGHGARTKNFRSFFVTL